VGALELAVVLSTPQPADARPPAKAGLTFYWKSVPAKRATRIGKRMIKATMMVRMLPAGAGDGTAMVVEVLHGASSGVQVNHAIK